MAKNRRTGLPELPYSGGLLCCAYCGQSVTGERIKRKLKGGGYNEHVFYRCANNSPGPDHPKVRWKAEDLEQAIVKDPATLRMPDPEIADWFRMALEAAVADLTIRHTWEQSPARAATNDCASALIVSLNLSRT